MTTGDPRLPEGGLAVNIGTELTKNTGKDKAKQMNEPGKETTLVDGVPVVRAASLDNAPAIRLTDNWDAAYHGATQVIEVCIRDDDRDRAHLFMKLDAVVKAIPRAQLKDSMQRVKPNTPPTSVEETATTLQTARNLLAQYRRILASEPMLNVFQMSQIHGAPYQGEMIDTSKVDAALADADRIIERFTEIGK